MRGRRAGARAPCFNLHGATALLITSFIIYTYRSFVLQNFPPLAVHRPPSPVGDQISLDGDHKTFDVDEDGIPDWCYPDRDGRFYCLLSDNTWTTISPDELTPSSTAPVDEPEPTSLEIPAPTDAPTFDVEPTTTSSVDAPVELPSTTSVEAPVEPSTTTSEETPVELPTTSSEESIAEPTSTIPSISLPTGVLPSPEQFRLENGTNWKVEYVGDIQFTDHLAEKNLVGDKCRSSVLGARVIWNCGDMWCDFDYTICGFAMGPAMYGTEDVMTINTTGIDHIYHWDFVRPHETDPTPQLPFKFWGMDTSNVAAINETHGVAYANEIWRGSGDGTDYRCGNAVASITLGEDRPMATRLGPLLTGAEAVEMGMLAILRDGEYIYIYSHGGPSNLVVTRVPATDDVFDSSSYESLDYGSETWSPGIPEVNSTLFGMTTGNPSGKFGCSVYGSVFYSNYFNKYLILCNIDMLWTNLYVSETPWGPWSAEYGLLHGWTGYGSMAHPQYSPGGSHKEFYFSQGPNDRFNMFKVTFDYDEEDGFFGT